jgi:HAE1 family hydrophobic/amphiphilic exporter-1
MAKVIIGGQMLSLILALIVTPVFYALLDMLKNFSRRIGIRFSVEPKAAPKTPAPAPIAAKEPAESYA